MDRKEKVNLRTCWESIFRFDRGPVPLHSWRMLDGDSFLVTSKGFIPIESAHSAAGGLTAIEPPTPNVDAWIHLVSKDQADLGLLLRKFDIHPLTIEDLVTTNARIKMERFPNYTFLSFRGLHLESRQIIAKNLHFIIRERTLITISDDPRNTVRDLSKGGGQGANSVVARGVEFVLHRILDVETDHTLGIVHRIDAIADAYERALLAYDRDVNIGDVYDLRNALQTIKKVTLMHKEVLDLMTEQNRQFFREESAAFFRDVRDHAIKALDIVDSVIQSINGALEAYITLSTRRTNEIIRVLTVMTAIMLPLTVITGIYGMNFHEMPMLRSPHGFWINIGIMAGIAGTMLAFFRWRRWL